MRSGGTPKRSVSEYWDKGTIPWVKIGDISGKYISTTEESISEAGLNSSAAKLFQPGTLLFSIFASIGAVGILTVPAATNQAIAGLEITSKIIDRDYLFYFLKSSEMNAKQSGRGVAQNNINLSILRDMKVPAPSLAEQSAIAREFERIDCQIDAANNQLSSLDDLVKSRFTEMFGAEDDVKEKALNDVCSIITDGTHQPPSFSSGGVPFLLVSNIAGNHISYETNKFISVEDYARLMKRTPVEVGDILVSAVGSFGHPAIVKEDKPFCFQRHIAYLKPKRELIDSIYLHAVLLSDDAQHYMDRSAKGVAQRTVTLKSFKEMPIHVPPLERQQEFAAFVSQVDKLRFKLLANPSPAFGCRSFCCSTNSGNGGVILDA